MGDENNIETTKRVTLLKGEDNYHAWSIRTESELINRNCWNVVDPGFGDNMNDEQAHVNRKARAYIFSVVGDPILEDIGHLTRAKEIWDALKNLYNTFSVLHSVITLKEMVNIKKTNEMSMSEYFAKIQGLNRKLQRGGIEFSDMCIAMIMLAGLPLEEYDGVVRNIEDNENVNTVDVKKKLLTEERGKTRTNGNNYTEGQVMANFVAKPKYQNDNNKRMDITNNTSKSYESFNCGKMGL